MDKVVKILREKKRFISTMESCTGGYIASMITDVKEASDVFKYSAVTYHNDTKIMMGVAEDIINTYGVYSKEVAGEMARKITNYSNADYGVGVTGKLSEVGDKVFVGIFDKENNMIYDLEIVVSKLTRRGMKEEVGQEISKKLEEII